MSIKLPSSLLERIAQARQANASPSTCSLCQKRAVAPTHLQPCVQCARRDFCEQCLVPCTHCGENVCLSCCDSCEKCGIGEVCAFCFVPNNCREHTKPDACCMRTGLAKVCNQCLPADPCCPVCKRIHCSVYFECAEEDCACGLQPCTDCVGKEVQTDSYTLLPGCKRGCLFCEKTFCVLHCLRRNGKNCCVNCVDKLASVREARLTMEIAASVENFQKE